MTKVPARRCRIWLARVWFSGAGLVFIILVVQSMMGSVYGDKVEEAWGWFLPTIMPTLSMIIGVLVLSVQSKVPDRQVDKFVFDLTIWLSAIYLTAVAATIFAQPVVKASPLELMTRSNLWLGPMQGLVAAALGAFFAGEEK